MMKNINMDVSKTIYLREKPTKSCIKVYSMLALLVLIGAGDATAILYSIYPLTSVLRRLILFPNKWLIHFFCNGSCTSFAWSHI